MPKIVLIEDEKLITESLERTLRGLDYEVCSAADGETGLALVLKESPDLVILDIMLPRLNGWEVCKGIRRVSVVPILMLTALNEEIDRILGLELGADDYVTKPFSTRELVSRIKALLRRVEFDTQQSKKKKYLSFGVFQMDLASRKVIKGTQPLDLRYKEFELLSLLVSHTGEVVTRAEIFDKVWGTDWLGDMRTLEVHIRWLREKLEADPQNPVYIQTVRSVGYRFCPGD
jgi:DNA-binding response OmpR family regulator